MNDRKLKNVIRQEVRRHLQENGPINENVPPGVNTIETVLTIEDFMHRVIDNNLFDKLQSDARMVNRGLEREAKRITEQYMKVMHDLNDLAERAAREGGTP